MRRRNKTGMATATVACVTRVHMLMRIYMLKKSQFQKACVRQNPILKSALRFLPVHLLKYATRDAIQHVQGVVYTGKIAG